MDGGETWTKAMVRVPAAPNSWQHGWMSPPGRFGDAETRCWGTHGEGKVQTERDSRPQPGWASGWTRLGASIG